MPWDQQPGETDTQFDHFQRYLNMPERPRRYSILAAKIGLRDDHLREMGGKFKWRRRASQYDNYIEGITEQDRVEVIKDYRLEVVQTAVEDVRALREIWLQKAENLLKEDLRPVDLVRLIQARNIIDLMARRAAELPATYSASAPGDSLDDDEPFELTLEGPKVDRKTTAITQVPADYQ